MITRKYTTALLVLTLILGAYYLHISDLRLQRLTEQYAQESAAILDQQHQSLTSHLQDIVSDLRFITEQHALGRFLEGERSAMEAVRTDLLAFATRKLHLYNRLILTDRDGTEIIRADNRSGTPALFPPDDPREPEQRQAFLKAAALDPGVVHLALLDPEGDAQTASRAITLRLSVSIFGKRENRPEGVLVLDTLCRHLLPGEERSDTDQTGFSLLIDHKGGYLSSHDKPQSGSFARDYPEAWSQIASAPEGRITNEDGVFAYRTLEPLSDIPAQCDNCPRSLVRHIPRQQQVCRYLVKDFGTSQSPKSTRQRDSRYCPDRPALITTPSRTLQQSCSCATPS
ncbi:MAG: cache domain-containing protein [Candidatus Sedimenticola endophacoides]